MATTPSTKNMSPMKPIRRATAGTSSCITDGAVSPRGCQRSGSGWFVMALLDMMSLVLGCLDRFAGRGGRLRLGNLALLAKDHFGEMVFQLLTAQVQPADRPAVPGHALEDRFAQV